MKVINVTTHTELLTHVLSISSTRHYFSRSSRRSLPSWPLHNTCIYNTDIILSTWYNQLLPDTVVVWSISNVYRCFIFYTSIFLLLHLAGNSSLPQLQHFVLVFNSLNSGNSQYFKDLDLFSCISMRSLSNGITNFVESINYIRT